MGDYDFAELDLLLNFSLLTSLLAVEWNASYAMRPPNHSLFKFIFKHNFVKQLFNEWSKIYEIKTVGAEKQMIDICTIWKQSLKKQQP